MDTEITTPVASRLRNHSERQAHERIYVFGDQSIHSNSNNSDQLQTRKFFFSSQLSPNLKRNVSQFWARLIQSTSHLSDIL